MNARPVCDRRSTQWGKGSIEGYDPEGMYGRYELCLDTIGGRDGVRREWEALPDDEREAYIASHGKKEGAAFDAFLSKRVSVEIGRRDPKWFRTGEVPRRFFSEIGFEKKKVGKKFGKHCGEWGLDPAKREDRDAMMGIIKEIVDEADRVDSGDWREQPNPCVFYLKGKDLVIVNAYGRFVTVMKDAIDNKRYRGGIGNAGN